MKITFIGDCYSVFVSQLIKELNKQNVFSEIKCAMLKKL